MKVSTEPVGTRQVALTIEPDPERIQNAMRRAARNLSRLRPVRGFRPGRAPYAMVERMLGREMILNEALNDIAQDLYREAVEEAGIEPYNRPQLEVQSQDPLTLTANVALVPVVTLGDYAAIEIEPEPAVSVSEEQIDEQVELVRRRFAEHEPVERPVQMGDQVVCSIQGVADGETVVDQSNATLQVTDELTPAGFAEALVGMSADEERTFSLTYPEDFEDEDLADKNVAFTVKMITVRQTNLPAVDDDLAKMAGDYDTLAELREGLAEDLRQRLESEARQREAEAALAALLEQASVEYPALALENEVEAALERQRANMQQMGFTFEAYLRMTGTTEEAFRERVRPGAERALLRRLVLSEYARAEELTLSEQELNAEMQGFYMRMAAAYGERAEEMMQQAGGRDLLGQLYGDALMRRAMRHLTAKATGREDELAELAQPAQEAAAASEEDASAGDEPSGNEAQTDAAPEVQAESGSQLDE
ncbi:MAG: trigger factor [Anaerolineae bacterium]|nr:trigger factor [Anaerolineae bacterium]